MRLTTIRNGPKRLISVIGGLGLLQMVLESVIGCTSETSDVPARRWPPKGVDGEIPRCGNLSLTHAYLNREIDSNT